VLQGVHTLFDIEPSSSLWKGDEERESRMVFIGKGLQLDLLKKSFLEQCVKDK
jgi:G3E family GTPase